MIRLDSLTRSADSRAEMKEKRGESGERGKKGGAEGQKEGKGVLSWKSAMEFSKTFSQGN